MVSVTVPAVVTAVSCGRCGKTIATWDGRAIVLERQGNYSSFVTREATIQCHRNVTNNRGEWVACGHVNQVTIPFDR